jgi:hypothetical protein
MIVTPERWYMAFWVAMLVALRFVIRSAVLSAWRYTRRDHVDR